MPVPWYSLPAPKAGIKTIQTTGYIYLEVTPMTLHHRLEEADGLNGIIGMHRFHIDIPRLGIHQ